ncbi:MAG: putative addiction module antidote protein [Burkholderiales bacterium]|nr:putative addiction module antidote protein [Burkholderiales bacterium]
MGKVTLRKWDSAEHLKTDEDIALYPQACLEEAGDAAAFIAKALGTIARAKGMSQFARDTGHARESLYEALSGEGNPSFATILKVLQALGIRWHVAHACVGPSQCGI